jgi:hypothetical protein
MPRYFLRHHNIRWDSSSFLCSGCAGYFLRGQGGASKSAPHNAETKNVWGYTSIPPYVCMAWCLVTHQRNLFLPLPLCSPGTGPVGLNLVEKNFLFCLFTSFFHSFPLSTLLSFFLLSVVLSILSSSSSYYIFSFTALSSSLVFPWEFLITFTLSLIW